MNLQPLKWKDEADRSEAQHEFFYYRVIPDHDSIDKFAVRYKDSSSHPATGFATMGDAKEWAWDNYNEKMQPYLDASRYPAQFEECFTDMEHSIGFDQRVSDGFVVTFRDVPEANTQGDTFIEAVEMAQDALQTAMEFYDEDNKPRPKPSAATHGDVMIDINSEVTK